MNHVDLIYTPIKIGTVLAIVISWSQHKSILMALVMVFLGGFISSIITLVKRLIKNSLIVSILLKKSHYLFN